MRARIRVGRLRPIMTRFDLLESSVSLSRQCALVLEHARTTVAQALGGLHVSCEILLVFVARRVRAHQL